MKIIYLVNMMVNYSFFSPAQLDCSDMSPELMNDPQVGPEKKAKPLFSAGEGRKREIGKLVWNNDGLELHYILKSSVQFEGIIFGTNQFVGKLGA
jgi:hypothetical protein